MRFLEWCHDSQRQLALRLAALACLVVAGCSSGGQPDPADPAAEAPPVLRPLPVASELPYYESVGSGPLVIFLAWDATSTLYNPGTTNGVAQSLIESGFTLMSFDLPCHGAGQTDEKPLRCWRDRLASGDLDLFLRFCAGMSKVIDTLGETEFAVVGQSRGGYVAATCAAYDNRLATVILSAPVTDLQLLSEFDGYAVDQTLFGLSQYYPYLRDKKILVRIGEDDQRVGTDAAIQFAAAVAADLDLLAIEGHSVPKDGKIVNYLLD